MNLTKDFLLAEFTRSETASRMGRPIVPDQAIVDALTALCENVLQPLRDAIGVTIQITSGYRPSWLNAVIGGSTTSQHMRGEAADINAVGYTPLQLCEKIVELGLPFDQLIQEFDSWTHVSYAVPQRRSILTARRIDGKAMYLKGLV